VETSEKDGELPRRDILRDPQRGDVPAVEHLREVRDQGVVASAEPVSEEHAVPRDAQQEHPGAFPARRPGKGRAESLDSPREDRMPGCVQAGPVMHAGDVEQELLDPPRLRVVQVFFQPGAPLLHGIV